MMNIMNERLLHLKDFFSIYIWSQKKIILTWHLSRSSVPTLILDDTVYPVWVFGYSDKHIRKARLGTARSEGSNAHQVPPSILQTNTEIRFLCEHEIYADFQIEQFSGLPWNCTVMVLRCLPATSINFNISDCLTAW